MDDGGATKAAIGQSRRLTTVVAADICGYSRLAEIDDAAAVRTVHIVRAAFETVVAKRRGRLFHSSGDGFLAEFPSAADGVLAALDFIADIRARDSLSPTSPGAKVRAGVHSGDVMEQPGGDLLGHGVNIAARLQAEAAPNGVLVSQATVNLVHGSIDAEFHRRGALALKNIEEPVVAFEVFAPGRKWRRFVVSAPRLQVFASKASFVSAAGVAVVAAALLLDSLAADNSSSASEIAASVGNLAGKIYGEQVASADAISLTAAQDAASSLLLSEVPDKRRAVRLIDDGNLVDASNALEAVLKDQVASGTNVLAQAQTLREIGALTFHRDTRKSLEVYQRLYKLSPTDNIALYQLGRLAARVNNPELAHTYFAALKVLSKPDTAIRLKATAGIIDARISLGDLDDLDLEIENALASARRLGLAPEQADLLAAYAVYEDFRDDNIRMLQLQRQVLVLENSIGRPERIVSAQATLGAMLIESGNHAEAREHLNVALESSRAIGDRRNEGSILFNLAYLEQELSNYSKADEFAKLAHAIAVEQDRPQLASLSLQIQGAVATQFGDYDTACRLYTALAHSTGFKFSADAGIVLDDANKLGCAISLSSLD